MTGATVEINTHPGEAGDPDLGRSTGATDWADELAMLSRPATRALVSGLGYRLGSFRRPAVRP